MKYKNKKTIKIYILILIIFSKNIIIINRSIFKNLNINKINFNKINFDIKII